MEKSKLQQMKDLLDETHEWPSDYVFKFIFEDNVETEQKILDAIPNYTHLEIKPSRQKKYKSLRITQRVKSADEVLEVYQRVQKIKHVISL